ncbi:MAG: hypothetical protein JWR85_72 [Marmoricola sp.]|nr:hypothetical protein [Marmoricola sp.]
MKPVRYVGAFAALVVLAGSAVLSISRPLGSERQFWVLLASFVPWAIFGYAVALVVFLLVCWGTSGTPRKLVAGAAVVSLLGLCLHVGWLAPSYVGKHAEADPNLTVLGLNLHFGLADPAAVARLVEREAPEVIVLSEATPEAVRSLASIGVGGRGSRWSHRGGLPLPSIAGTVVLSAYPITDHRRLDVQTGAYRMRIVAPKPFWLTAVHTTQPLYDNNLWRHDFEVLAADAGEVKGPHVQVGDFNATLDHGPMRDLLDTGLHDAAAEANSGWQPTWPSPGSRRVAGRRVPIRVMAIDHVLLSKELSAVSTSVHPIPGTDHEALVARLVLR